MSFLEGCLLSRTASVWHMPSLMVPLHTPLVSLRPSVWRSRLPHDTSKRSMSTVQHHLPKNAGSRTWWFRLGRYLRWTPLPVSVALVLVAFQRYRRPFSDEKLQTSLHLAPWQVSLYRYLPLRSFSRLWGCVNNVYLPVWARKPVLGWYARTFGCDMSEALYSDLTQYNNLADLFRRQLKPGLRPVDLSHELVSPVDGTIMCMSVVDSGRLEQVKGVSYSLSQFMGSTSSQSDSVSTDSSGSVPWPTKCESANAESDRQFQQQLLSGGGDGDSRLYQCVIYLAPGDYHRFHAPADWYVQRRRHFVGQLLSVGAGVMAALPGLLCLNERVVYMGRWRHGFFSMTAVGATNVGSISVYCDQELTTNTPRWSLRGHRDRVLSDPGQVSSPGSDCWGVSVSRGQMFGEFNMGSTIVLLFEAPSGFETRVACGSRVRVGEALGRVAENV